MAAPDSPRPPVSPAPSSPLDPRKAAEIAHWRAHAHHTASLWGWDSAAGRLRATRRVQMLEAAARLRPGTRVLELGCGTGTFTRQWAATGATLLAVDLSHELLRLATAQAPSGAAGWAVMDIEALGLREAVFDAVVGVSVLHHVDLPRTLAEVRRVLRPGGRIAFSEPNGLNPQVALQENIPFLRRRMGYTPYETSFTRWGLARALRRSGFVDVHIVPFDFLHPGIPRGAIPLMARAAGAAERVPLLREIAGSLFLTASRP